MLFSGILTVHILCFLCIHFETHSVTNVQYNVCEDSSLLGFYASHSMHYNSSGMLQLVIGVIIPQCFEGS
jgi:hypothetical protein